MELSWIYKGYFWSTVGWICGCGTCRYGGPLWDLRILGFWYPQRWILEPVSCGYWRMIMFPGVKETDCITICFWFLLMLISLIIGCDASHCSHLKFFKKSLLNRSLKSWFWDSLVYSKNELIIINVYYYRELQVMK